MKQRCAIASAFGIDPPILLMDERFLNRDYRNLFPREWNDACTCTLGNVEKHLQAFWDVSEENDIIG